MSTKGGAIHIEKLSPAGVATGERTLQFYSRDGLLLYEERSDATPSDENFIFANGFETFGLPPSGPVAKTSYHYLGKTLVARKDTSTAGASSTSYLHTDVMGSVVAETNASQTVTRRTSYQPFGLSSGSIVDGPNFTAHVLDTTTGLVYMQGRYYDPDVGRFLSIDPTAPSAADGEDFNRYAYVRNNPYRAVDPDGHAIETLWDVANVGIGVVSFGRNVAAGNLGAAALDAVGVLADSLAAVGPGIPGGAATAIKAARAADAAVDASRASKGAANAEGAAAKARILEANQRRGAAGEAITRERLGDRVAGEQVTIRTSDGTRTRTDFITTDKGAVETKTGDARLTPGQRKLKEDVQAGRDVTPVGRNAERAGLEPGRPVKLSSCDVDRPC